MWSGELLGTGGGPFFRASSFLIGAWPDVEPSVIESGDLPRAPDPTPLAEPTIKDIVPTNVALGPPTFEGVGVISAADEETSDVIDAETVNPTVFEGQMEIHPMPVARPVVVEAGPWTRREQRVAHRWTHRAERVDCQKQVRRLLLGTESGPGR